MRRRKKPVEDEMELTPEQLKVQKEILHGLGRPEPFKKRKKNYAMDIDSYSVNLVDSRLRNRNGW